MQKALFFILILALSRAGFAAGVTAYPLEARLDERTRTATVTLFNMSDADADVRLNLVDRQMLPDGQLVPVASTPAWSAARLLRFSPRQVRIPAHGQQTVRVIYRRDGDLTPGEYRSHLEVHQLPDATSPAPVQSGGGVTTRINVVTGFSLPVFVSQGEPKSDAAVKSAEVIRPANAKSAHSRVIRVVIEHQGNAASNTNLQVISGTPKEPGKVLLETGLIVLYPEISQRIVEVALRDGLNKAEGAYVRLIHGATKTLTQAPVVWNE